MKKNMFKKMFAALAFCFIAFATVAAAEQASAPAPKEQPLPIYKKISQENLKTLVQKSSSSDTGTISALINDEKTYAEMLQERVDAQINPDPYAKRQAIFTLLNQYEEKNPLPVVDVLEEGTWKDLEILCGPKTKPDLYVASMVDRTVTEVGRAMLFRKIIQPTDNIVALRNQQEIVKKLVEDEALFNDLDSNLKKLAVPESVLLSFWGEDILGSEIKTRAIALPFENNISFLKKITSWMNKEEHILMANSMGEFAAMMVAMAIVAATTVTVPTALAMKTDFGKKCAKTIISDDNLKKIQERIENFNDEYVKKEPNFMSFTGVVSTALRPVLGKSTTFNTTVSTLAFVFAVWGAWRLFKYFQEAVVVDRLMQTKLIHLATYVDALNNMICSIKKHDVLHKLMPNITTLDTKIEQLRKMHADFDHLLSLLATNTFKGKPSFFSFWRRLDVAYRLMEQEKEKFNEIMIAIGELDAQMSIARLYKEMKNNRVEYCFPTFQASTDGQPFISINDFWHPCINPQKVVANSIDIDGENVVISGPNAGGKSTIMKAFVLCIIMAQALGIAPAKSLIFAPFSKIVTYLNITDDIAAGNSHFKAGVLRARDVINEIGKLKEGQYGLSVVDEVFNGTTFKEGQAAAYSFINHLGQEKGNMLISTTHFPMMAGLAQTNDRFVNYKVYVEYDEKGKIKYPYKLEKGFSDQIVTLKILKEEGFADKFVEDAEKILAAH